MSIKSDEISSLIKQRIKDFDVPILAADVGILVAARVVQGIGAAMLPPQGHFWRAPLRLP